MKSTDKEHFSTGACARIRRIVIERQMANYELANKADVAYKTVYSIMHNRLNPQPKTIGRIAAALGVSVQYLMTGTGDATAAPMIVRDGTVSPETGERGNGPCTLDEAMKTISTQLGIPADDVRKAIAQLLVKQNHKEDPAK